MCVYVPMYTCVFVDVYKHICRSVCVGVYVLLG